ncbi:MAG: ABC transporter substrate-binding protein [Pseudomonadota bacterium]
MRVACIAVLVGATAALVAASAGPGGRAGADTAPPPSRVVSMNLCTDQLAMLVAAPGQLVSVSFLASDPQSSAMAAEAARYPANHGLAEEIFLLAPDLVIAGTFTTRATVSMLRRLGIPVVEFEPADSLEAVRDRLAQMGRVLGRQTVAARIAARFDADLEAARADARADARARPRAALYFARGYTLGRATLAGSVLDAAGLANVAMEAGYDGGGTMPLEELVALAPALVVTGRPFDMPAKAQALFDHPALRAVQRRAGTAPVADRDWVCGTPFVVAAVRRLVAARDAVLAAPPARE